MHKTWSYTYFGQFSGSQQIQCVKQFPWEKGGGGGKGAGGGKEAGGVERGQGMESVWDVRKELEQSGIPMVEAGRRKKEKITQLTVKPDVFLRATLQTSATILVF